MSKTKYLFSFKKIWSECLPSCQDHSVNMWKVYKKMFTFETTNLYLGIEICADALKYTHSSLNISNKYFLMNSFCVIWHSFRISIKVLHKRVAVLKPFTIGRKYKVRYQNRPWLDWLVCSRLGSGYVMWHGGMLWQVRCLNCRSISPIFS